MLGCIHQVTYPHTPLNATGIRKERANSSRSSVEQMKTVLRRDFAVAWETPQARIVAVRGRQHSTSPFFFFFFFRAGLPPGHLAKIPRTNREAIRGGLNRI